MKEKTYIAIDLKSFYASQECVERGLDPLSTHLVVADASRTEKTICLAVTPSLKACGVPGRARLFEVLEKVSQVNALRRSRAPGKTFSGKSADARELAENPALEMDFLIAPPRMAHYMECSAAIYQTYLRFVAPEDIHVYSIDEVFLDATPYLKTYGLSPREFAQKLIDAVLERSGITATAGIGTNLYLCKVAMDIVAKHMEPDKNGARIAQLDEQTYRRELWTHRPLTDFWRVGRGYARTLQAHGLFTMGDIARCSLDKAGQDLLYRLFGVNAELLIDHAWGWEPCTIRDIKSYRPENSSICSGQVLTCPYPVQKARLVVREMADLLAQDLVDKMLVTDQIVLTIGYDRESLTNPESRQAYSGPVTRDAYGREIPKHAHGTENLGGHTASESRIIQGTMALFDRIVNPGLLVRRISLTANHLLAETDARSQAPMEQMSLFEDAEAKRREQDWQEKEKRRQQAVLAIRKKYGKNAILKGMNLEEGATAKERNHQIGGHKA